MQITKWDKADKYTAQTDIVKKALATNDHSLDELLRLMRDTCQSVVYLSGTRLDNDYCFGSGDIGLLFSVLPEDAQKAAEPGFHPGSTEVYITFQGSVVMECLEHGQVKEKIVNQYNILTLSVGQCHRVRFSAEQQAASVIVKTNLRSKPGVVRCDNCTYYLNRTECPLFQRWDNELQIQIYMTS